MRTFKSYLLTVCISNQTFSLLTNKSQGKMTEDVEKVMVKVKATAQKEMKKVFRDKVMCKLHHY